MNKSFKKILGMALVFNLLSYSPAFAYTTNNDNNKIYEYSESIDLSNLNLSLEGESLNITSKSRSYQDFEDKNNLTSILSEDPELEKQLVDAIKAGGTPVAISTSEKYVEELVDVTTNEITSRFLTNSEVKELNNPKSRGLIAGETGYKGKLTLRSTLVTGLDSLNTYSFSLSASWDISGYNGSTENSPASGDDFIALCWPNAYDYKGISEAQGYYYNGADYYSDISFYRASAVGNAGISWGFQEKYPSNYVFYGADSVTAFAHIVPNGSKLSYKTFTAEYIHTYEAKKGSVSIGASSSSGTAGISISNVDKQWKIVSPLTSYIL